MANPTQDRYSHIFVAASAVLRGAACVALNGPTWTWLQLVAFATMTLPKEPEDYVTGWSKSNPREEEYQASCDVFSVKQAVTGRKDRMEDT